MKAIIFGVMPFFNSKFIRKPMAPDKTSVGNAYGAHVLTVIFFRNSILFSDLVF